MAEPIELQEKPQRNGLAIASLVFGALSVAFAQFCHVPGNFSAVGCLGPLLALGALATGILGIREAQKRDGEGQKPAVGGLVTASIGLAVFAAVFIPVMLTPGGLLTYVEATPTPTITPTPTMTPTPTLPPTITPTPTPTPATVVYKGKGFTITFTDDWQKIDLSGDEFCGGPDIECFLIEHSSRDGTAMQMVRYSYDARPDLDEADEAMWSNFRSASLVEKTEVGIDGERAIKRVFVTQLSRGGSYVIQILAVHGHYLYQFLIFAPSAEVYEQHQAALEEIIASFRFTTETAEVERTLPPETTPTPAPTSPPSPIPTSPSGDRTYPGDGFALTYPEDWEEVDRSGDQVCQQPGVQCVRIAYSADSTIRADLMRFTFSEELAAEDFDRWLWGQITADYDDFTLETRQPMEIDGRPAVKRVFHGTRPTGEQDYILQVAVTDGRDGYYLLGLAPSADAFEQHQVELEEIITSLRFTD